MSDDDANDDILNQAAQGQLKSLIERIERLEAEKAEIAAHIKEVYAEAKGNGFDTKVLRKVVRIRKMDRAKRLEEEAMLDLYLSAIGELPLFEGRRADSQAITRVELTTADGRKVGGTPAQVRAAISEVKDDDALYAEALTIVRGEGKASTSYIQRRLQIGYNRAAALIEQMEADGVVGPPDHAGRREVLAGAA